MRIREINCGTLAPLSSRLTNGSGAWLGRGRLVCRCLLVEGSRGLLLVDSGIGTMPVGRAFGVIAGPRYDPRETAVAQVRAFGFRAEDVRDIVVTHLDLDHAGGLCDFPRATVHVRTRELDAAVCRPSLRARFRYRSVQWAHGPRWEPYGEGGDRWRGWEAVSLRGVSDEVLLLSLPGHSPGHGGVAVRQGEGWILHAGDAFYHRGQVDPRRPWCPPGLTAFQEMAQWDRRARLRTLERLRSLSRDPSVRLVCAHDPGPGTGN